MGKTSTQVEKCTTSQGDKVDDRSANSFGDMRRDYGSEEDSEDVQTETGDKLLCQRAESEFCYKRNFACSETANAHSAREELADVRHSVEKYCELLHCRCKGPRLERSKDPSV